MSSSTLLFSVRGVGTRLTSLSLRHTQPHVDWDTAPQYSRLHDCKSQSTAVAKGAATFTQAFRDLLCLWVMPGKYDVVGDEAAGTIQSGNEHVS